jgi:hypothetical protein
MPNSVSLQGHALVPASHVHTQTVASTVWNVEHNIGLPGLVHALAYDPTGQWISPPTVAFVDENHATLTFASAVSGSATVFMPGAFAAVSLRVGSQLEVNGVEMTGSGADLLVGGTALSKVGHAHQVTLTGDAAGTATTGTDLSVTLAPTGVTPGTYGTTSQVPVVAVDAKGRVTSIHQVDASAPLSVVANSSQLGWNDIVSDLIAKGSGSTVPTMELFSGLIYAYTFIPTAMQQLFAAFHIRHDYAPGTPVHLHVHWSDASAAPSGNVRWGFEYAIAKGHGQEAFPANTTTVYVEQAAAGQRFHMVAETGPISSASIEPDALILVRVFRGGAHVNDTNPASVFAFTADVHYQTDRVATVNRAPNFYGA